MCKKKKFPKWARHLQIPFLQQNFCLHPQNIFLVFFQTQETNLVVLQIQHNIFLENKLDC